MEVRIGCNGGSILLVCSMTLDFAQGGVGDVERVADDESGECGRLGGGF
jgi:hypothetical protein